MHAIDGIKYCVYRFVPLGALAYSTDLVILIFETGTPTEKGLAGRGCTISGCARNFQKYRTPESLHCGTNVLQRSFILTFSWTRGYLQLATSAMVRYSYLLGFMHCQCLRNMFSMVPEAGERYLIVLHK